MLRGAGRPRAPAHQRLGFDEFDYGFVYRRIREDTTENDELWTTGRVCLWPNCLYAGHFEWRVPIDDEHTLSVGWFIDELPGDTPFEQDVIPCWHAPVKDERTGRWIDSHVMNQDFIAWVGQGAIADRSKEHLGESDRGVILMRKRLLEDVEAVAAGRDPKGTIRDPAANHSVHLPIIGGLNRPATRRRAAIPSRSSRASRKRCQGLRGGMAGLRGRRARAGRRWLRPPPGPRGPRPRPRPPRRGYGLGPGDLRDWAPLLPIEIYWALKHDLTAAAAAAGRARGCASAMPCARSRSG